MKEEVGNKEFQIWLLGDSNPSNWDSLLEAPFDPRHPVRHNIWTPIIDVIQDQVFRELRKRIDTSKIYIRNAIQNPNTKPRQSAKEWDSGVNAQVAALQEFVEKYQPRFLFSFGAFSFEFGRRTMSEEMIRAYGYWGAKRLGDEFRKRISGIDNKHTNLIPLLHRSISGGKFLKSHNYFCGESGANYFEFVGSAISAKMISRHEELNIWIE